MRIKRGDIFWIEQSKYRPAVGSVQKPGRPGIVVSNDTNNTCSPTVEIVYLTGKSKGKLPTHCTINSTGKPSIALCEQITTVSTEQLRDYIGQCTDEEMEQIDRCITISLGLPHFEDDQLRSWGETLVENRNLEMRLSAANARADLLQEMYNNLLEHTMA